MRDVLQGIEMRDGGDRRGPGPLVPVPRQTPKLFCSMACSRFSSPTKSILFCLGFGVSRLRGDSAAGIFAEMLLSGKV